MTAPSIERKIALATGNARYFTGKPCKHGHISERFSRDKVCVECHRIKGRRQYAQNPEKFKSRPRKHYVEDPHRAKARLKRWRAENPDKTKALRRLHENHRRARKLEVGGSYTNEQILDLFKKQKGKCVGCFCSIKHGWHNDHIVALARGGSNDISNIQLLCQPCNSKKHAKDPIEWAQENGRLL